MLQTDKQTDNVQAVLVAAVGKEQCKKSERVKREVVNCFVKTIMTAKACTMHLMLALVILVVVLNNLSGEDEHSHWSRC